MPIYEYQCAACGHSLESFQKMSDAPLTQCPNCEKDSLQKLVSAAGFQLKGTGWYATDFRNKGKTDTTTTKKEGDTSEAVPAKTDVTTDKQTTKQDKPDTKGKAHDSNSNSA